MNNIIGLFGGGFDPPHLGHYQIMQYLHSLSLYHEIWMIPSYSHPNNKIMADFKHRKSMCEILVSHFGSFAQACTIEAELPQPNYTLNTVKELYKRNPNIVFEWIVGSDSVQNLHQWYHSSELQEIITFCIIGRTNHQIDHSQLPKHYRLIAKDILNYSSSEIREKLSLKLSSDELLLPEVQDYIYHHTLYV